MKYVKQFVAATIVVATLAVSPRVSALAIDDDHYVGSISPGHPSGEADELGYINNLVDFFNGGADPSDGQTYLLSNGTLAAPLPAPGSIGDKDESPTGTFDVTDCLYIIAKYGNYPGEAFDQVELVWYVGDITGNVTLATTAGLSHITCVEGGSRVPDGGATLALLGLALSGVGLLKRRSKLQE